MLNLTPHAITIRNPVHNLDHTFRPSGTLARVDSTEVVVGICPTTFVEIVERKFGEVTGLPEDDTPCIVSALVLAACPGRPNTFAPDTGPTAIRNEKGHIVAVTRLVAA